MCPRGLPALARLTAAVVLWAGPAAAADFSVRGSLGFSATGLARFGESGGRQEQESGRFTTDIGATITRETPNSSFATDLGARLTARTDEQDGGDFWSVNPRILGRFVHRMPRLTTNTQFSVVPQLVSDRDVESIPIFDVDDPGEVVDVERRVTEQDPLQITLLGRFSASYRLDNTDSLTLSAFVRAREYDEPTDQFQPTRSYGFNLGWNRSFDSRTRGGVSIGNTLFTSEREDQDESTTTNVRFNLSRSFTPRHRGNATVGLSTVDGSASDVDFIGGLGFVYRYDEATSLTLGANQNVAQDDDGELRTVTRLRAVLDHGINEVSSVNLGTRLSFDTPVGSDGGGERDATLGVSLGYSHRLTESWRASLTYAFQVETDQDSFGDDLTGSNRLVFRLSRALDILP
jgi:hypothetical protein